MAARRWYDGEQYWEMQPLSVVRSVAPYRRGPQARLRATARCLLLQIIGHDCSRIPLDASMDALWIRESDRPTYGERSELALVARDALLELGYDAAADEVNEYHGAKTALILLEGGPPSIRIGDGHYAIFKHTIRHLRSPSGGLYLVGRCVNDPKWWYRFAVGKAVHDRSGRWIGWDREAGHTFLRRGRSLADVKAGKLGSEPIA